MGNVDVHFGHERMASRAERGHGHCRRPCIRFPHSHLSDLWRREELPCDPGFRTALFRCPGTEHWLSCLRYCVSSFAAIRFLVDFWRLDILNPKPLGWSGSWSSIGWWLGCGVMKRHSNSKSDIHRKCFCILSGVACVRSAFHDLRSLAVICKAW